MHGNAVTLTLTNQRK